MSVRMSLTLEVSEMFLSLHMIFSLERAAVVWAILERTSGVDPLLEMIAARYLKFSTSSLTFYLDLSLEAIWVVCHHFCLAWTDLHFVSCGGCIETVYQVASFFFLFCNYDKVICKAEVGNKSSSDADTSFIGSHMILSRKMLKQWSEQYSVHLLRISFFSVRHFPGWSCMVVDVPCFSVVMSLTSWYAFLLLFFLRHFSTSCHWPCMQVSFATVISVLIFILISPSGSPLFFFKSRLRSQLQKTSTFF